MLTKAELDNVLVETKALKVRTEAAEAKVAELENEKSQFLASKGYTPVGHRNDSDEARCLKFFGVAHPKELLNINIGHPRFKGVPDDLKALVLQFKRATDNARWIAQMFYGDQVDVIGEDNSRDRITNCKNIGTSRYGREVFMPMVKAFGSTVSGGGDEWVPTMISSSYIEEYELMKVLESKFKQVNMPSNPFSMPKISGVGKAKIAAENTAMTATQFTTGNLLLTAKKFSEYYEIPEELSEDSAPDFLMAGKDEVMKAQARAVESAIINGDDDGTHIDSDTQAAAANVAEKAWKGLRRQALANSANGSTYDIGGALTDAAMKTMQSRGGKFLTNPKECVWILSPAGYIQALGLTNVATVDKFGPQATILQGALAAYNGIPIVTSEHARDDLNATGVYDGTTTTKSAVLLVNATRWYVGQRRPIKIKLMADLPAQDRWLMASYRRVAFVGNDQSATEKSVVYGYNVTI
jgi:HK97 family phage major capsid protein